MNVGTAKGQFKLDGLKQSIVDLKKMRDILVSSSLSYKKNRKEQKGFVSALKQSSNKFKKAAGSAKFFKQTIKNLNAEMRRLRKEVKNVSTSMTKVGRFKAMWQKVANGFKKSGRAALDMNTRVKKLDRTLKKNTKTTKTWISRFGSVAAGFWVAYRAINAVEHALVTLFETWSRGASLVDEFRESVSTSAGMLALMSSGLEGFTERYTKFSEVMKGTMEESIRLAPKYRLSLEDIGNAYKEFAQFGVVITRDIVEPTLISIAMIKEIATTTSGAAKQIRQEIQAIFNGQARITDQFAKFVKRFPGLRKQIFGIAKEQTSNNQKWKDVIEVMSVYKTAIEQSNKTIVNQSNIIKNNLSIISGKAIVASGIYDRWVKNMEKFNESLFDDKGRLLETGRVIYGYFYRVWQIVDKLIGFLVLMGSTISKVYRASVKMIKPYWQWIAPVIKVTLGIAALRLIMLSIAGIAIKIWTIFKGLTIVRLIVSFRALLLIMSKMVVQVLVLVAGFRAWAGIFAGIGASLGVVSIAFGDFFDTIISNVKVAAHNFKELGKALTTWDYTPVWKDMVDVTAFEGLGTKAGDAFFEAYNEQLDKFDDDIKARVTEIGATFNKLFDKVAEAFVGTEFGEGLVNFKAELAELLKFEDIEYPKLREFVEDLADISVDQKGLEDINEELKKMRDFLSTEFSSIFSDIFSGEITKLNELWDRSLDGIVTSFEKAMADLTTAYFDKFLKHILADKTLQQLVTAITGSFSGGSGFTYTGMSPEDIDYNGATNAYASGGVISEPVFGVGLRSGESYSIGENGPETVTPGVGGQGGLAVTVNVINKTSNEVNAKQGKVEFDGKRYIIDTVLSDIETGGPLRSLLGAK